MTVIDWHQSENAIAYDRFTQNHPMYIGATRALLDLVDIEPDATILDIGCGTGASTRVLAESCSTSNRIIGIDYSQAQVEQAREYSGPKNVEFIHCSAEQLSQLSGISVDVAICNSAMWFLDVDIVLSELAKIGSKECQFAFNIFDSPIPAPVGNDSESQTKIPTTIELTREIANRKYGYEAPDVTPADSWYEPSFEDYVRSFDCSEFSIVKMQARYGEFAPAGSGGKEWWHIPVFLTSHIPGLEYEKLVECYDLACAEHEALSKDIPVNAKGPRRFSWVYLARRFAE
jgi:ubiquinone/menaquinone biosynthesis C-methylase UbiE